MYLRTVTRKNKNGSSVSYLQLAHNEWDAAAQVSRRTVLYNFGRADQVDRDAIARLIASLSQVLTPGQAMAATARRNWPSPSPVRSVALTLSTACGAAWASTP